MEHKLDRQKSFYNRKLHGEPFKEGDLVWLHSPVIPQGQVKKFHSPWTGPYKVVRHISEATYRVQDVSVPRRRVVVHFDRLKLCPKDIRLPHSAAQPPTPPSPPPPPPAPPTRST